MDTLTLTNISFEMSLNLVPIGFFITFHKYPKLLKLHSYIQTFKPKTDP